MACFKEAQLWLGFDLLFIMDKSMEVAENINQNCSQECISLATSTEFDWQPKSRSVLTDCKHPAETLALLSPSLSPGVSLVLPTRTAQFHRLRKNNNDKS